MFVALFVQIQFIIRISMQHVTVIMSEFKFKIQVHVVSHQSHDYCKHQQSESVNYCDRQIGYYLQSAVSRPTC